MTDKYMTNPELITFISDQRRQGQTPEAIRKMLTDNGWEAADIDMAFSHVGLDTQMPAQAENVPAQPISSETNEQQQPLEQTVAQTAMPAMTSEEPEDIFNIDSALSIVSPGAKNAPTNIMQGRADSLAPTVPAVIGETVAGIAETAVGISDKVTGGKRRKEAKKQKKQQALSGGTQKPVMKDGMSTQTKILLFFILIAVAALIAGGVSATYYFFYQSPDRISKLMVENIANLKSTTFELEIEPSMTGANANLSEALSELGMPEVITGAVLNVSGTTTVSDMENPKSNLQATLALAGTSGETQNLTAELRSLGGDYYFKTNTTLRFGMFDLTAINDIWFEGYNRDKLMEKYAVDPGALEQYREQQPKNDSFTPEEIAQIQDAFRQNTFLTFTDKVGTEDIHGHKAMKYKLIIDNQLLQQFLAQLEPIMTKPGRTSGSVFEGLAEYFGELNGDVGYIWIGRKDYNLYQIEFETPIEEGQASTDQLKMKLTLWNHNDPVVVEKPEEARSFEELYTMIISFGGITGGSVIQDAASDVVSEAQDDSTETLDTDEDGLTNADEEVFGSNPNKKDTDEDGLEDYDEKRYKTDPNKKDTDGDGYEDGEEVENGYNPSGEGKINKNPSFLFGSYGAEYAQNTESD